MVTKRIPSWLGLCGAWLVACGLALPAAAQTISGEAAALDGDSLVVDGRQVRLFGIDAPEFDQTCTKDGADWACGQQAKDQLAALILGQTVVCQGHEIDQHNRLVATCSAGLERLNQVMVEEGWATAYRQFSDQYIAAEVRAKARRLGIWSSTFVLPSEYRMAKLPGGAVPAARPRLAEQRTATPPSSGCVIKGNRNRRGEWIYHLPGMPYYNQTRPEEIFCT